MEKALSKEFPIILSFHWEIFYIEGKVSFKNNQDKFGAVLRFQHQNIEEVTDVFIKMLVSCGVISPTMFNVDIKVINTDL